MQSAQIATRIAAASSQVAHRTLVYSHRGGWAPDGIKLAQSWPNSMLALRRTAESGADGMEFDIQRTADDRLVTFHDPEPRPYRNEDRISRTLAELEHDGPVVTFDDFLAEAAFIRSDGFPNFRLNPEFKLRGLEGDTLAALRRHDIPLDAVVFSSFNHHSLQELRRLEPAAKVALLAHTSPGHNANQNVVEGALRIRADVISIGLDLATPGRLQQASDAGLGVMVFSPWRVHDSQYPGLFADDRITGVIVNQVHDAVAARRGRVIEPAAIGTNGEYPWNRELVDGRAGFSVR